MAWVKLDDHFDEHPKIARLDNDALALFVCGLAYCNRNLTDGFIPFQVGRGQLRYCNGGTDKAIDQLETVGCWEPRDGGWYVHDYDDYQMSREQVLAERERGKSRAAKSYSLRPKRSSTEDTAKIQRSSSDSSAVLRVIPSPVPDSRIQNPESNKDSPSYPPGGESARVIQDSDF